MKGYPCSWNVPFSKDSRAWFWMSLLTANCAVCGNLLWRTVEQTSWEHWNWKPIYRKCMCVCVGGISQFGMLLELYIMCTSEGSRHITCLPHILRISVSGQLLVPNKSVLVKKYWTSPFLEFTVVICITAVGNDHFLKTTTARTSALMKHDVYSPGAPSSTLVTLDDGPSNWKNYSQCTAF